MSRRDSLAIKKGIAASEQAFRYQEGRLGHARLSTFVRGTVAPTIGLMMFWPMFRYASFVRVLYPGFVGIGVGGARLTGHVVFLCMLVLLTVLAFALHERVARFICDHHVAATVVMGLGTACAALAMLVQEGSMPAPVLLLSTVLVAGSLLTLYLAWAMFFSEGFSPRSLVIVVTSFLLSYVCFSYSVFIGSLFGPVAGSVILPVGSSLAWFVSVRRPGCGAAVEPAATEQMSCGDAVAFSPAHVGLLVLAVDASLLVGAAVRGIVDLYATISDVRFYASLALNSLWLVASILFYRTLRRQGRGLLSIGADSLVRRYTLVSWSVFSLAFLSGLFAFLALGQVRIGGDLVVVSRTAMAVVLWILLCDAAVPSKGHGGVPDLRVFLIYGIGVEVVSWFLSYAVIPAVVRTDGADSLTPETFVLAVIFGGAALSLTALILRLMLATPAEGDPKGVFAEYEQREAPQPETRNPALVELVAQGHLTEREAAVIGRYAQGLSLGKVAEELGITKSTAQSHIKNAYRKLDVHSRDELIERMRR